MPEVFQRGNDIMCREKSFGHQFFGTK